MEIINGVKQNGINTGDVDGVAIDDCIIGGTTPAAGTFASLTQSVNNVWLTQRNNADSAAINMLKVNTSDEIEVGANINFGAIEAVEDSGAVSLFDMSVSASPAVGVEESVSIEIDSNVILKVYAEADSSGGIQNQAVKINAPIIYSQAAQILTGAGAVNITSAITHVVTTGADALTLVDGVEGQEKFIVMKTDANDGTLTPTNLGNGTTITFNDVGDSAHLLFTNGAWYFMGGTATLA